MTVEIIIPENREAWLAARSQDVTASVGAAVLNAHPYTTQYRLWAEKTGRLSADDEETEAMERGNLLEPVVVSMVRKRHPDWEVIYENDRAYYRDAALRIGATPDAFVIRPDRPGKGNMQIKTASEGAFKEYWLDPDTGDVIPPTWIALQAIIEAKLTGCAWACVAVVVLTWRGTLKLHVVDIPLHDRLYKRLLDAVAEFWRVTDAGDHPPVDWERDGSAVLNVFRNAMPDRKDLAGDAVLEMVVGRYHEAKEQEAAGKKLAATLKPQIIYALGNSEAGLTATWVLSAPSQYRAAHFVKASESRPLRISKRRDINVDF